MNYVTYDTWEEFLEAYKEFIKDQPLPRDYERVPSWKRTLPNILKVMKHMIDVMEGKTKPVLVVLSPQATIRALIKEMEEKIEDLK